MPNVLLAIDGPLYANAIVDFVANHRWAPGTNFKLLHIMEPSEKNNECVYAARDQRQIEILLSEIGKRLSHALPSMNVTSLVQYGQTKSMILRKLTEWPADMLILGSHEKGEPQQFETGSVTCTLMTQAPCSVLLVRLPAPGTIAAKSVLASEPLEYCASTSS